MNNRYSDELIEEIRIGNDIVDVVSEYLKLEKKGKNYFGLCPFHREKTPSFSVEANKQIFYCFGCGKGGNVFQFVSNVEKIDYIEAVRLMAERAKILLPENEDEAQKEIIRQKQQILNINLHAARYFHEILNSRQGDQARNYLDKRGISEQTIKKFGLGFISSEWEGLYKHLRDKDFDDDTIVKSGMAIKGKNGNIYDRFRERIIFPIFDIRGNVIAFGGRIMDNSLPKYMNSPETIVYNKGRNLYALNFAKNSGEKRLIIVEGYMDVISLHQSGINNAVASLGTAMTENQGRILKKYAEEIIIAYDADTAGQAATLRSLDILNDMGCAVKVLSIPEGKDPDEFIRKNGADKFSKLANGAFSLLEYKIKTIKKEIDTSSTEGRILFLNKAADLLSKVDNSVEREMYIKKIAKEYEISEEAMFSEVIKKTKPKNIAEMRLKGAPEVNFQGKSEKGDEKENKLLHNERFILSLVCTDNSIFKAIKDIFDINMFSFDENKKLAGIITERLVSKKGIVPAELLDFADKDSAGEFARILNEECHCDDNVKAFLDKIKSIERYQIEIRQKQIIGQLKDEANMPKGDVEKLKLEFKDLALKIKEIKKA